MSDAPKQRKIKSVSKLSCLQSSKVFQTCWLFNSVPTVLSTFASTHFHNEIPSTPGLYFISVVVMYSDKPYLHAFGWDASLPVPYLKHSITLPNNLPVPISSVHNGGDMLWEHYKRTVARAFWFRYLTHLTLLVPRVTNIKFLLAIWIPYQ